MATKLIFIRHGESMANFSRIFTGQGNFPLSPLGHKQADLAGQYLKDTPIDVFYASDLSRAFMTGQHVAAYHGIPVIPCEGMREIHAGKWEGMRFNDIESTYVEEYRIWKTDIGRACPVDGERVTDLAKRVYETVLGIVKKHPDSCVCIATHATPIRALQAIFSGLPIDRMCENPWVPNASITTVICESDGTFHDLVVGDVSHLAGLETVLPKNV